MTPCLFARSAQVGGAGSCWVAKYSSRAFCMHDSFSSSAFHAFTAAGTGSGFDVKLWLQGYPILMCGLLPLQSINIDFKHVILNANTCFWQSCISTMHFPVQKGEVGTQVQPIALQTDIQGTGKSVHAGKHFQCLLYVYLHMIPVFKSSLGCCVTHGSLSGVACWVVYSKQKNWLTKGQILLVSQITAQRTKLKLWEIHVTKLGILSFGVPNNKHSPSFVDLIYIFFVVQCWMVLLQTTTRADKAGWHCCAHHTGGATGSLELLLQGTTWGNPFMDIHCLLEALLTTNGHNKGYSSLMPFQVCQWFTSQSILNRGARANKAR